MSDIAETWETVADIPEGIDFYLCPPGIEGMMTGVDFIVVTHNGNATLHYVDGSTETAPVRRSEPLRLVHLIEAVQSQRQS